MRSSFFDFYPPTAEDYQRLWREATIVLDTNVLLNLYRLPDTARKELLDVLELLKDRLWIPHQVALEFQRKRLSVIATERKSVENALGSANNLVSDLKRKVDDLQLDKRGLGIEPESLISELGKANSMLIEAIQTAQKTQLDISLTDPIRDRVDALFESKVGNAPVSQDEINELTKGGEDRYKDKIPPGFMDSDKEKNPNEAVFIFNKLKYQRKFGDLILWRQIINEAKNSNIKTILFVTSEQKEDWWNKEHGKIIGPQSELIREIREDGGVDLFWMYSSSQFLEYATKFTEAKISEKSLQEIKIVAMSKPVETSNYSMMNRHDSSFELSNQMDPRYRSNDDRFDMREIEHTVGDWLESYLGTVEANDHGFPDFISNTDSGRHGFDVKYVRHFDRMLVSPPIVNSLLRGYLETNEGRLDQFTLIIVITQSSYDRIAHAERIDELGDRLSRLLSKYPVDSILVGSVFFGKFNILYKITKDEAISNNRENGLPDIFS